MPFPLKGGAAGIMQTVLENALKKTLELYPPPTPWWNSSPPSTYPCRLTPAVTDDSSHRAKNIDKSVGFSRMIGWEEGGIVFNKGFIWNFYGSGPEQHAGSRGVGLSGSEERGDLGNTGEISGLPCENTEEVFQSSG
jgi:hypothetical protein